MHRLCGALIILFGLIALPAGAANPLQRWKLTLPIDRDGDGRADEERATEGAALAPWFSSTPEGLRFRAPAGGARTSTRTAFARSELRELDATGKPAAWACMEETRSMLIQQRLLATTTAKPEVTIGQIHDARNDNAMIKYTGPSSANGVTDTGRIELLWNNASARAVLDPAYRLGETMRVRLAVSQGTLRVDYRNLASAHVAAQQVRLEASEGGCFFKAGLYIQACSLTDSSARPNLQCAAKAWPARRHDSAEAHADLLIEKLELDSPALP